MVVTQERETGCKRCHVKKLPLVFRQGIRESTLYTVSQGHRRRTVACCVTGSASKAAVKPLMPSSCHPFIINKWQELEAPSYSHSTRDHRLEWQPRQGHACRVVLRSPLLSLLSHHRQALLPLHQPLMSTSRRHVGFPPPDALTGGPGDRETGRTTTLAPSCP